MINWIYRNKTINNIEDLPKDAFGFVYEITFSNGMKYVGSKYLYHKKTLPPLKGKKRKRKSIVESDWKTYYGSFKDKNLKSSIAKGEITPVKRQILKVCYHRKQVAYYETKYLFTKGCLEKDEYYNGNILGKYFKKDV